MKTIIIAGLLVIFISVFFMLFIINDMSFKYLDCQEVVGGKLSCSLDNMGLSFVISLMMIGVFVIFGFKGRG